MFKRNSKLILSKLKESKGKLITSEPMKVYVLKELAKKNLIVLGDPTSVIGSLAIMDEKGNYAVFSTLAMYRTKPSSVIVETVDENEYYVFSYDKNTPIFETNEVVINGDVLNDIMSVYIYRGLLPFFMGYDDPYKLFSTSTEHCGVKVDKVWQALDLLITTIARTKKNINIPARLLAKSKTIFPFDKVRFIALANVQQGVSAQYSKLTGNHEADGLMSALVNDNDVITRVEKITRS